MEKMEERLLRLFFGILITGMLLVPCNVLAALRIETVAGNGTQGLSGDGGPATAAAIDPQAMTVDVSGNIYFVNFATNSGSKYRKINTEGIITSVAPLAGVYEIVDMTVDSSGNVYILGINGYSWVSAIFKLDTAGNLIKIAEYAYTTLWFPLGIALDGSGNIYIADTYHNRVCKRDTEGILTTVASISRPNNIEVDSSGYIYISDRLVDSNHGCRILQIDASGNMTVVAGNGTAGFSGDGGPATDAAIVVSSTAISNGNIYIADNINNRIRKVDAAGIITTVAGNGNAGFSGDGGPATDAAIVPHVVSVDGSGNIYFADYTNNRIRKVYDLPCPGGCVHGQCVEGDVCLCDEGYEGPACETPTIITLSSFTASPKAGRVILQWTTESEIDNSGFNLYRSESETGEYIKINDSLIPAEGSATQGASYTFTDDGLKNRKTYWYKLEDIDLNGKSTRHGPVNATQRLIKGLFQ